MKKDYKKIILQTVRRLHLRVLYFFIQMFVKQENNNILFLSFSRSDLSGNFGFIYDMIKNNNKYKINSILSNTYKNKNIGEIRSLKNIAKAKYILVDDFIPMIYTLKLKKDKKLIQVWHALGAYKTVGYARLGKPGGPKGYNLTHRNYTDVIVSSENIRKDYARAFGIDISKVHALGIPRTDIFFDSKYKKDIKNKLYKKYPILKNKKVILFAPTFRGAGKKSAHYNYDWIDFDRLKQEFKDEYVCIIKLHPFIKNKPNYKFNDDFYLDLTKEREINDLLFITDILITDYSSVIFEYSFFNKPLIFYTPDFNEYISSRSFFYDFDKYNYGQKADNFNELINCIKNPKTDTNKIKEFYNYFCLSCDGKSTKRFIEYFFKEDK